MRCCSDNKLQKLIYFLMVLDQSMFQIIVNYVRDKITFQLRIKFNKYEKNKVFDHKKNKSRMLEI